MLHSEMLSPGEGAETVVLVHGFTQSGSSWEPVARRLPEKYRLVAVDAPGHGRSHQVRADLVQGGEMIAKEGGVSHYVGYSMGGRFALHLALLHPETVKSLILVGAHPGIEDERERAERLLSDEQIARRAERDGVETFVRWWLRRPIFASLEPHQAMLETRLGGSPAGLASSMRLAGTGAQAPLWARLDELQMPVLLVAGEADRAYRERAERMATLIGPNAAVCLVRGAGHACHLECPGDFTELVQDFLARTAGGQ